MWRTALGKAIAVHLLREPTESDGSSRWVEMCTDPVGDKGDAAVPSPN